MGQEPTAIEVKMIGFLASILGHVQFLVRVLLKTDFSVNHFLSYEWLCYMNLYVSSKA